MKKIIGSIVITAVLMSACIMPLDTTQTNNNQPAPPTEIESKGPLSGSNSNSNTTEREARMKARNAEIASKLNLSAAQEEKFNAIQEKYNGQMKSMRQNGSGDFEARRTEMQALRTKQSNEIRAILNTQQFNTYTKMMEEGRGLRRGKRGGGERPKL